MPTDLPAAPDGALDARRSSPFRPTRLHVAGRAGAWLLRLWKGHVSRRALPAFDDHMLADIGMHRDARALRGGPPHDPWFLARHLR